MPLTLILICLALVVFLMTLAWWVARTIDRYSIVEPLWALCFALIAPLAIVFGTGYGPRKLLIGSLFALWGLRLGLSLAKRTFSRLDRERSRYVELRHRFGAGAGFRFFLFYLCRAFGVVLLAAPLFVAVENAEEGLHPFEIFGSLIWFLGMIGQSLADLQASRFHRDPKNLGRVLQSGLWRYSRHPNLFFEAVIWLGYGVFALATPDGWIALYAPVLRWILLARPTARACAEETILKTRGEAYRDYQRRTSAFFPLPPRG